MRKIVSVVALSALLFFAVIGVGSLAINPVNAEGSGTSVKGIISTNTTWTLANSPYNLTGPILVNRSVTLTIEAGVTVNFRSYFMQVDGVLNARGSETHPIRFEGGGGYGSSPEYSLQFTSVSVSWDETTESGSIIDYAAIYLSPGIEIQGSSPRISNSLIKGAYRSTAIWVDSGSPLIVNNTILASGTGIHVGPGGSPLIVRNTISSANGIGIYGGSPKIYWNRIVSNQFDGITVDSSQPFIANNTISENLNGLQLLHSSSPTIIYNNITGNKNYDVLLNDSPNDVNMTYNWWGTTDTSLIDQHIHDFYDDFRLGKVIYTPILNSPPMIIQSNQNPPPQTTLTPQVIILICFFILAAISVIGITILKLKKRKSKNH